jgi:hypothetical protein
MNGFSAEHSKTCRELKISDGKRAFFMGNALLLALCASSSRRWLSKQSYLRAILP